MTLPAYGPRAPYLMAADELREQIRSGRLKPGDRLPSSRELRDTMGIANATVHSALRVLREEGLIYSVQGRGTYVADAATANSSPVPQEGAGTGDVESTGVGTLLREVRDQLRELSAVVSDLTQRVEALETKAGSQPPQ
ncbi:winged helix-turn-helix domain-containing protein [Streptomyces sp. NPDC020917]|uniref:winged helix-turn-helix domain-containing protein n=1 Tax=Streptomyces sp. NPDC020917 TaxID=3365102 RepID=UPI00378E4BD6